MTATPQRAVRLGTRGSALALTQTRQVAAAIEAQGVPVEVVVVTTAGDRSTEPLASLGGTGVFVSALRDAVLGGEVDAAVHSLKDLPTAPADGLVLAAVPPREDPRDVVVARDGLRLDQLDGVTVGTGSPRRAAQLRAWALAHRRTVEVVDIRGNVDTRVGRVADGSLDAVVLARAGLARLQRLDVVTDTLEPAVMLPAPGQGALAVEARSASSSTDDVLLEVLARLDAPDSRAAVAAERAVLAALEAGCSAPVGALAAPLPGHPEELDVSAVVVAVDGSSVVRMSTTAAVDDAVAAGHRLAARMLDAGAAALMGERIP